MPGCLFMVRSRTILNSVSGSVCWLVGVDTNLSTSTLSTQPDQAYNCLNHLWDNSQCTGRQPFMEDNCWWKTTFDWRQTLPEDNLWLKTTFDGRQPLLEDDLKNKYSLKMKKIMFLSVLGLLDALTTATVWPFFYEVGTRAHNPLFTVVFPL